MKTAAHKNALTKTVAHSTEYSQLVRIESFRVLDTFLIGILSSIEIWRQLLEQDTQQLMFGKCCCIRITLWTILTRPFLPTFAVCLRSYHVDRGCQWSGRHCQCHRRQDRRDVGD